MESVPSHSVSPKAPARLARPMAVLLCVVFVLTAFITGLFLGRQQGMRFAVPQGEGRVLDQGEVPTYLSKDVSFGQFWDVWNWVKESYYEQPVSDLDLYYGAMAGLMKGLGDEHSSFFNPKEASDFNSDLEGSFEGIGAEIGMRDDQLVIIAPLEGSPAEQAGLMPGDAIYAIDGEDAAPLSVEEAVTKIRGEKGTSVTLTISRDGMEEAFDVQIVRDTINIDSVEWKMRDDGVAVVSIYMFNEDTTQLFTAAVNDLLAQGAKGVVLDLRSNPGGLLTSAIEVASSWTGKQTVLIEKEKDKQTEFPGVLDARLSDMPTVVLVNGGSASASEIVSGALQDYGYAKLVGTTTFGKGSVQDYRELDDGSAVKLTVAQWLTPKGRFINKIGIEPDEKVDLTVEDLQAGNDPQMDKALEVLRAEL